MLVVEDAVDGLLDKGDFHLGNTTLPELFGLVVRRSLGERVNESLVTDPAFGPKESILLWTEVRSGGDSDSE